MKLLVLHRIPYHKINYHRGIDHGLHEVTYLGEHDLLKTIPSDLNCLKIAISSHKNIVAEVLQRIPKGVYDRIIALSEYNLLEAALLREHLGIPGPRSKDVVLVRDKIKMKAAVAASGLRVPINISCKDYLRESFLPWSGASVLKPIDGASSVNVTIHADELDLLNQINRIQKNRDLNVRNFEIEEYVHGDIWHFDGLVHNGKVVVMRPSKYVNTCFSYANGLPLASLQMRESDKWVHWVQSVISAVRIQNSSFHLEAIITSQGPCFLEIGARVGGADVVDTFEMATGVHLPSTELALALNQSVESAISLSTHNKNSPRYYGWFVFPGHHLKDDYCNVMGASRFVNHSQMTRVNVLSPNQKVNRQITYQAKEVPFSGVIQADSTEDLHRFISEIFESVKVMPRSIHINSAVA